MAFLRYFFLLQNGLLVIRKTEKPSRCDGTIDVSRPPLLFVPALVEPKNLAIGIHKFHPIGPAPGNLDGYLSIDL